MFFLFLIAYVAAVTFPSFDEAFILCKMPAPYMQWQAIITNSWFAPLYPEENANLFYYAFTVQFPNIPTIKRNAIILWQCPWQNNKLVCDNCKIVTDSQSITTGISQNTLDAADKYWQITPFHCSDATTPPLRTFVPCNNSATTHSSSVQLGVYFQGAIQETAAGQCQDSVFTILACPLPPPTHSNITRANMTTLDAGLSLVRHRIEQLDPNNEYVSGIYSIDEMSGLQWLVCTYKVQRGNPFFAIIQYTYFVATFSFQSINSSSTSLSLESFDLASAQQLNNTYNDVQGLGWHDCADAQTVLVDTCAKDFHDYQVSVLTAQTPVVNNGTCDIVPVITENKCVLPRHMKKMSKKLDTTSIVMITFSSAYLLSMVVSIIVEYT